MDAKTTALDLQNKSNNPGIKLFFSFSGYHLSLCFSESAGCLWRGAGLGTLGSQPSCRLAHRKELSWPMTTTGSQEGVSFLLVIFPGCMATTGSQEGIGLAHNCCSLTGRSYPLLGSLPRMHGCHWFTGRGWDSPQLPLHNTVLCFHTNSSATQWPLESTAA